MGKLPWIIYQTLASILKKGGWPLVVAVSALVLKGILSSYEDIKKYVDEWTGAVPKSEESSQSGDAGTGQRRNESGGDA